MKILLLGANGFIGSHLAEAVLRKTDWTLDAFDLHDYNIAAYKGNPSFSFTQGDLFKEDAWLEDRVKEADVVLPFAGIAKPAYYLTRPLWTFELDFEQNLKIIRMCAKTKTRVIFPSTSEVYGLSHNEQLIEDETPLVVGPVSKTRWIYSCSKQMMDRLILAYSQEQKLPYTIFRPFNWIGPRLDTAKDAEERTARSITQMIYDILHRGKISLVDGGTRRRSFTWVGDAMEALLLILHNPGGKADGQVFNIGNPANNASIRALATLIIEEMKAFPAFKEQAEVVKMEDVAASRYYKKGYEDMKNRIPSIAKIKDQLGWQPKTSLRDAIRLTLEGWKDEK